MTQIDFYILPETATDARWLFVCRLIEKAVRLQHQVLVTVDARSEAEQLDDLLWTFKPESFIAHRCIPERCPTDTTLFNASVEITFEPESEELHAHHHGLLINLSRSVPGFFSRFERLSEVVIQQPEILKNTRDHYSFFRERGYPIQHRKM